MGALVLVVDIIGISLREGEYEIYYISFSLIASDSCVMFYFEVSSDINFRIFLDNCNSCK